MPKHSKHDLPNQLTEYRASIDRPEQTQQRKQKEAQDLNQNPTYEDHSSEVDKSLESDVQTFEYSGPACSKNTKNSYTKFLQSLILLGLMIETANQIIPAAAAMPSEQIKTTEDRSMKRKESNDKTLDLKKKDTIKPKVEFNEIPKKSAKTSKDDTLLKVQQKLFLQDTSLHNAVERSDLDSILKAIKNGANLEVKNKYGYTPLEVAIRNNSRPSLALLLALGANPNITIFVEGKELPALHYTAIHPEMYLLTKELLMCPLVQPDNFSEEGVTALMLAVRKGNLAAVMLLLQFGANPLLSSSDEILKALDFAHRARANKGEIISLLKSFTKIRSEVRLNPNLDVSMSIEEAQQMLCIFASRDEYYEETQWLLKNNKINVNQTDANGSTAMHYAASINKSPRTLALLIQHNADINARNKEGNTPLMEAVLFDNELMCLELLSYGADINSKNPLHHYTAKTLARDFQKRNCQNIIEHFETVQNHINNKHHKQALEYIRTLPILKNNLALKVHLAFLQLKIACLEGLGRYETAIKEVNKWLTIYPTHYRLHFIAGKLALKTYQYKDALSHFKEVVHLNPNHAEAQSYIPILDYVTNDYYSVKYQKNLPLNDFLVSSPLSYLTFEEYQKICDVSEATYPFIYGNGLSQQQAENLKKQLDLMISKSQAGQNDEGLTICDEILSQLQKYESYPYFSIAFISLYYHRGVFKKNQGDLDGALEAFKICSGVGGKYFYGMLMLGNVLLEKNMDSEALEVYRQAFGYVSKNWDKVIKIALNLSIPETKEAVNNFNTLLLRIPKSNIEQLGESFDSVMMGLLQLNSHFNKVGNFPLAKEILITAKTLFENFDRTKIFKETEKIEKSVAEAVLKTTQAVDEDIFYKKWIITVGLIALTWQIYRCFRSSPNQSEETKKKLSLNKQLLLQILKDLTENIEEKENQFIITLQNGSFTQETDQTHVKVVYSLEQLQAAVKEVLQHYFFQINEDNDNNSNVICINKKLEVDITSEIAAIMNKDIKKILFDNYQTERKRVILAEDIQLQLGLLNKVAEDKVTLEKSLVNLKAELELYPEKEITGIPKGKKTEALYKKYSEVKLAIINKIKTIEAEIKDLEKIAVDLYQVPLRIALNRLADKNNSLEMIENSYNSHINNEKYAELVQKISKKHKELQIFKSDYRSNIDEKHVVYTEAKEKYLKDNPEIKPKEKKHQPAQVPNPSATNQLNHSTTMETQQDEPVETPRPESTISHTISSTSIDPNNNNNNNNNPTTQVPLLQTGVIHKKIKSQNDTEFNLQNTNIKYVDVMEEICSELIQIEDVRQLWLHNKITSVEVEAKLCQIIFKMVRLCEITATILNNIASNKKISSSAKQIVADLIKEIRIIRNFYRHQVRKYIHKVLSTDEVVQKLQYYSKDFATAIKKFVISVNNTNNDDLKNDKQHITDIKEKLTGIKRSIESDLGKDRLIKILEIERDFIESLATEYKASPKENDFNYSESISCSLALLGEAIWEIQNYNKDIWTKFIEVTKPFSETTQNNIKAILSDTEKEYFVQHLTSQPLLSILLFAPNKAKDILAILNSQDSTTLCLEFFSLLGKGLLPAIDVNMLETIVEHVCKNIYTVAKEMRNILGIDSIRFFSPPSNNNNNVVMEEEENTEVPQNSFGMKHGKEEE